jgi:Ca-activated chloride channel family protein
VPEEQITPKEMIFVIDCSGSMRGFPIEKAKKTMSLAIEQMNPNDTFNLISFAGGTGYCFNAPVPNTRENRRKALDYLSALQGGGGTEMMAAIQAALANQHDPERLRIVCFMTDGFIANDMAILDAIKASANSARVFGFGIGNSVNRFLIEGMGRLGRGASEIVTLESDGDSAAERFQQRINNPILTDITLDFSDLQLYDIFPDPQAMPDLFSATPLVVKGRFPNPARGVVTVRGMTAKGPWERKLDVDLPADEPEFDVLAPLWAREKIADLMDQDWLGAQQGNPNSDIKGAVTALGLEFGLVTQYTSFVAVEEKVVNEHGRTRKVEVPVEMPDGVSYEGIFGAAADRDINGNMPGGFGGGGVGGRQAGEAMQSLGYGASAAAPMAMSAPEHRPAARQEVQNAPPRVMAEEAPAREPAADAVKPEAPKDGAALAKIDATLRSLAQNPRGGNYESDGIRVSDGATTVVIVLTQITDDKLAKLKVLGADITATAHSSKSVMAKVPLSALLDIAQLDFVTAIRSSDS